MPITLEESIKQFYDYAENIGEFDSFTASDIFEKILQFYETRVTDSYLKMTGICCFCSGVLPMRR